MSEEKTQSTSFQNSPNANDEIEKERNGEGSRSNAEKTSFEMLQSTVTSAKRYCLGHCCAEESSKIMVKIEEIILVCICVAVAMGFCVPVIIYAVDSDRGADNSTLEIQIDVDNCPSMNTIQRVGKENKSSLELYDDMCVSYSGQCLRHLEMFDDNLLTRTLIGVSENDIVGFVDILNQFMGVVSEQCAEVVLPFLCQYVHPPCDGNGSVNLISQEQCSNIRDVVCANEWRLVMATSSSSLLPVCEHFSDVDNITYDNTTQIISQPLQCHYQFKEYCGLCLPLCGEFSQYRARTKLEERSVLIFAGVSAFIGGILVFIAAIFRRESLLDFPAVLVMYNTLCAFIVACFILITYIVGQERLYCTHEALSVAFGEPSAFCQVSGLIFHWLLVLLSVFWLLHLIHLFLKIAFPMWSRTLNVKRTKIILHVTEVGGATLLSGLAPIIFVSVSEYNFGRFPPVLCFPSRAVTFYTMCLPVSITIGSGVILAIITFWILHKRQQLFKRTSSKYFFTINLSVPEVKILILSCYFVVFGIMALVNVSISVRDSDIILDKLFAYFTCQATGYDGPDTCVAERDDLESYLKPELNAASYFLLGIVPWTNLLFAIQVKDIKKLAKKIFPIYSSRSSQEKTSSTANTSTH